MAGVDSIFADEKVLIAGNASDDKDAALMAKLGLCAMTGKEPMRASTGHPGLEPGSRCLDAPGRSGIPGQARDDG